MLPRRSRIARSSPVRSVRPAARAVSASFQCTVFLRADRRESTRFSISVGKTIAKSAVMRNTMRRRVSAVIERHLAEFAPGIDIHIRVMRSLSALTPTLLEKELYGLLFDAKTLV